MKGTVPFLARMLVVCAAALTPSHEAAARTLEQALVSTFPGALRADGEGLAEIFALSVAASFPVTGASASYAYRFDPATDSLERMDIPLGPVFSERARTVGAEKLILDVNYEYLDYGEINGQDLSSLTSNDPRGGGAFIAVCFPPPDPVCEPVLGRADIDLEAQIVSFSATYGVTPDLDLNINLPVVRTFLRSRTSFTAPDPRVPPDPSFRSFEFDEHASESSVGAGDLLLRAKYRLLQSGIADLAAGFMLSLPSGDSADFQGTGDTLVGPSIYASRLFLGRLEPHLNLGFLVDADNPDRSRAQYSAGADVRLLNWLTVNSDFLGRSDLTTPGSIDRPVFVQIERADVLQFSIGLKVAPVHRVVAFVNAILPLNHQGLRSDVALAAGVQVTL